MCPLLLVSVSGESFPDQMAPSCGRPGSCRVLWLLTEPWEINEPTIDCSLAIQRSGLHSGKCPLSTRLQSVWQFKKSLLIVDDMKVIDVGSHFWAALLGDAISWRDLIISLLMVKNQDNFSLETDSVIYLPKPHHLFTFKIRIHHWLLVISGHKMRNKSSAH